MDESCELNQSQTVVGLGCNNPKCGIPNDDQCFLLYLVLGTYFGPDIKGESPKKSVLQRVAEGLPPYTSDQLTSCFLKIVELERVYYYLLRKADKSFAIELPLLRQFFQGQGEYGCANYPRFADLFPPELHPPSWFRNRYKVIENIVFINNPQVFYIKQEDVERFKRLSGLDDFQVDKDAAMLHTALDGNVLCNMSAGQADPNGNMRFSYMAPLPPEDEIDPHKLGPAMLFLPSRPTKHEWSDIVAASKNGFALTGSAALGQVGPIIGLVDIGECEDAYLFRVSLPGVKRDEKDFSCEADTEGKVLIHGVTTTGEKTVTRYSQEFEMQTHNLCPPGHFSITFQLPGPVDPHQFSGNFGTDGILEGIVMKGKRT